MNERLNYRLRWQTSAVHPGAHPGQMVSAGQLFKRHALLLASPDPRRIDLRASVLDPFNDYRVRVYQQHTVVNVLMIADLSASMGYRGVASKPETLKQLLLGLADSAFSYGDSFGFIGCAEQVTPTWIIPPTQHLGHLSRMARQLQAHRYNGNADALTQSGRYLPRQRALVFLVSDFHFPLPHLQETLSSLQGHDVVPIILWDAQEIEAWPDWRFVTVQDAENRRTRTLFMRPALRRKIQTAYQQRQQALTRCFRRFGMEPLLLRTGYSASAINRYFEQSVA